MGCSGLQDEGNLQTMPGWLNPSKQDSLAADWRSFPSSQGSSERSMLSPDYRAALEQQQNAAQAALQKLINGFAAANKNIHT